MNETQIEHLRQKLFGLRSELQKLEESAKEAARTLDSGEAASGSLPRMAAMQAQLKIEDAIRRPQRQLGKIEGAFRRIDAGDYGNCFMCGEEIEIDRLSEDPTCTRCIKCVEI